MAEKVTEMLLKVHDLECSKCYKKVKKILSKFPQIQDQVYDEKNNTVTIKVVCCSPEKIRDKIYCKGRGIIICIQIVIKPQLPTPKDTPTAVAAAGAIANATATAIATAPEVKIDDKTTIVFNFFDVPKPPEKPKPSEEPKKPEKPKTSEEPKKPEEPKTPEVKIKDKNTIEVNFLPKPCYCGRNCDGYCGRPLYCSCGCGGYEGGCGRPVCSCGCGGRGGNCRRPVCSCGCGGLGGNCRRPVCSCGCGGRGGNCRRPVCSCGCGGCGGNCVRPVYCSCGCGGYRGNCGSRCSEYYSCEDNSQGCTIV